MLGLGFVIVRRIRWVTSNDAELPPEDKIAKLMLAASSLREDVSPELAMRIESTCGALEAMITVVEQFGRVLGTIAATASAVLRLKQQ